MEYKLTPYLKKLFFEKIKEIIVNIINKKTFLIKIFNLLSPTILPEYKVLKNIARIQTKNKPYSKPLMMISTSCL